MTITILDLQKMQERCDVLQAESRRQCRTAPNTAEGRQAAYEAVTAYTDAARQFRAAALAFRAAS